MTRKLLIPLEAYSTLCVPNGHIYEYFTCAEEYGRILACNVDQTVMRLVPLDNSTFSEFKSLMEKYRKEYGLAAFNDEYFFSHLLAATLDVTPEVQKWYVFGHIPCPICGEEEQAVIGPTKPQRFQRVELEYALQTRWASLNQAEKDAVAYDIALKFKSEWHRPAMEQIDRWEERWHQALRAAGLPGG